jgi:hypothetical protein
MSTIKPRGQIIRSEILKKAYVSLMEPQFEIAAWHPDDEANLPAEQVHFIIHWPLQMGGFPPMAIRFKSPDTLGFFIEELIHYRRLVWPDSHLVTGENGRIPILPIQEGAILRCEDCGRPYGDPGWIDCILPDDQWLMIHPEPSPRTGYPEGGILCGACMIKRAEKLPHAHAVRMCIDLGNGLIGGQGEKT